MAKKAKISFDFDTCFGRGKISKALWNKNKRHAKSAFDRVTKEVEQGQLGFWKLPADYTKKSMLKPLVEISDKFSSEFENLVIIGIGGSSLGARMLINALAHRYHNELPARKRQGPRIYLMENIDPDSFSELLEVIDISKTIFNVVSKSGSTVEPGCQFVLVLDKLKKIFPNDWQKRLVFTTDPELGILRPFSKAENIAAVAVPQNVGGRYSVFSPVGLLPALALGVDIKSMLAGAAAMSKSCLLPLEDNPALKGALMHYLADRELNKNMLVVYPYADRLQDWTEWFCQLWAESIGKEFSEDGEKVNTGSTPIKTLGANDQHSQSQLYMEGPNDKVFMFLRVNNFDQKCTFPPKSRTPKEFQYLAGHSMQELIKAEQTATKFALGSKNRMTYQVDLPKIDSYSIGQLVFWAEAMTVFAGYMYGINPFDQPGVELGKKFAYGLMGRAGFEDFRKKILG